MEMNENICISESYGRSGGDVEGDAKGDVEGDANGDIWKNAIWGKGRKRTKDGL